MDYSHVIIIFSKLSRFSSANLVISSGDEYEMRRKPAKSFHLLIHLYVLYHFQRIFIWFLNDKRKLWLTLKLSNSCGRFSKKNCIFFLLHTVCYSVYFISEKKQLTYFLLPYSTCNAIWLLPFSFAFRLHVLLITDAIEVHLNIILSIFKNLKTPPDNLILLIALSNRIW